MPSKEKTFNRKEFIDLFYLIFKAKRLGFDIKPFYTGKYLINISKPNLISENFVTISSANEFLDKFDRKSIYNRKEEALK